MRTVEVRVGGVLELGNAAFSDLLDIGLGFPEGSMALGVSVFLEGQDGLVDAPVEVTVRSLDEPVIRLVSQDARASVEITDLDAVGRMAFDGVGIALSKAGLIATGIVPTTIRDATVRQILEAFGCGVEISTYVDNQAQLSGFAVSRPLAAAIATGLLRLRGLIASPPSDDDKGKAALVGLEMERLVSGLWSANLVTGEGAFTPGGLQQYGAMAALWEGVHVISAQKDRQGGASTRTMLHPVCEVIPLSREARELLEKSIMVVHSGLAWPAQPILEAASKDFHLRRHWEERQESMSTLKAQVECLRGLGKSASSGDQQSVYYLRDFGRNLAIDWENRKKIAPSATDGFCDGVVSALKQSYGEHIWGWGPSGVVPGAGSVFVLNPEKRDEIEPELVEIVKRLAAAQQGQLRIAFPVRALRWKIADEGVHLT